VKRNAGAGKKDDELLDIEMGLLLEGVYQQSGVDFRQHDRTFLKSRVLRFLKDEGFATVSELQSMALRDLKCREGLLQAFAIGTPSLYADPSFFRSFREIGLELLRGLPELRVWIAGCAGGEDAYAFSILFKEEGLTKRVRMYATELDDKLLSAAKTGIIFSQAGKEEAKNYLAAGGKKGLPAYYASKTGKKLMSPVLRKNITWAQHSLVTDASFNQFHSVVCRNVLGYFSPQLKARVHGLLYESLTVGGLLGIGSPEEMNGAPYEKCYVPIDDLGQWFRKVK
jgi:chemotaxis protein methyltransferase CheR